METAKGKLETNRLILRGFQKNDAEKCFENWGQDESHGRYLPMFPMKNRVEMEHFISGFVGNPNVWLVEERLSGESMGYISVDIPYDILGIGEIGYVLGEKYQHKGYAAEAVGAVISYLFSERKLYMVEAKYNEKNTASGRLLSRLGFQTDGVLRDRRMDKITGERNNLVVCSITGEEEKQNRASNGLFVKNSV